MKKLISLLLLTAICHVSAAYNDFHYEGINPDWKTNYGVEGKLNVAKQFLPDDPIVVEAGAYDGTDSIKIGKTWPKGTILSFEPNPAQFAKYCEKAINFPNMHGYNLALNTYNGTATFYLCWGTGGKDPIFEGASSLLEPSKSMEVHYQGPVIQVPCVIFDDWCIKNSIDHVDYMWLDMEGFELQFLKSSPKILSTVKVIQTETNFYNFRNGTAQYKDLKSFLESQGFALIAHWYNEGLQGDAIFVRRELLP